MTKSAIAIVGYNRTDYFQQVVEALAPQVKDREVFIFLDKSPNSKTEDEHIICAEKHFNCPTIIAQDSNIGCGLNMILSRKTVFDKYGFERAFIFEDDMVPSPHYVNLCEAMMDWAEKTYPGKIGAVQGWNDTLIPEGMRNPLANKVEQNHHHHWGYLMSKDCWNKISFNLKRFEDIIVGFPYAFRPIPKIQNLVIDIKNSISLPDPGFPLNTKENERLLGQNATTQDALTVYSMLAARLYKISTKVSRGTYIGKKGIHFNEQIYKHFKFDKLKAFVSEEDENIKEFEF